MFGEQTNVLKAKQKYCKSTAASLFLHTCTNMARFTFYYTEAGKQTNELKNIFIYFFPANQSVCLARLGPFRFARAWIHACIVHTSPVLSVLHNNTTVKTEIMK